MIQEINQGDQAALRDFLSIYAKHILDRATAKLPDALHAREATRMTILAVTTAAKAGEVPDDPSPWIDRLTDESVARLSMPLGAPAQKEEKQASAQPEPLVQAEQPESFIPFLEEAPTIFAEPAAYTAPSVEEISAYPTAWDTLPFAQSVPPQAPVQAAPPVYIENPSPVYYTPVTAQPAPAAPITEQPPRAAERPAARASARAVPDLFDNDREDSYREKPAYRDKPKDDAPVGLVFLIFLMVIVVLGLVWMLLVMLMSKGYLPVMDFGFANWFNANVFPLF